MNKSFVIIINEMQYIFKECGQIAVFALRRFNDEEIEYEKKNKIEVRDKKKIKQKWKRMNWSDRLFKVQCSSPVSCCCCYLFIVRFNVKEMKPQRVTFCYGRTINRRIKQKQKIPTKTKLFEQQEKRMENKHDWASKYCVHGKKMKCGFYICYTYKK